MLDNGFPLLVDQGDMDDIIGSDRLCAQNQGLTPPNLFTILYKPYLTCLDVEVMAHGAPFIPGI